MLGYYAGYLGNRMGNKNSIRVELTILKDKLRKIIKEHKRDK